MQTELRNKLLTEEPLFTDIIGQEKVKKQIKSALIAGRHIILVGPPGIGKTTLAKNIAELIPKGTETKSVKEGDNEHVNSKFIRVQGSPDLTAEDLLGDIDPIKALKYGPMSIEAFTPGKVFKANGGMLFFDEVNRCPEKLQNALLQILEEHKATIASYDVDFNADFVLVGTMNPEDSSTEPLSDVFLDRFDMIQMGYPETLEFEREIVKKSGEKLAEFPEELLDFSIMFVRRLRESKDLEKHPSVRASLGLYERAQANARIRNSTEVNLGDVMTSVESVISHRIRLAPSVKYLKTAEEFVSKELEKYTEQNPAITEKFSGRL